MAPEGLTYLIITSITFKWPPELLREEDLLHFVSNLYHWPSKPESQDLSEYLQNNGLGDWDLHYMSCLLNIHKDFLSPIEPVLSYWRWTCWGGKSEGLPHACQRRSLWCVFIKVYYGFLLYFRRNIRCINGRLKHGVRGFNYPCPVGYDGGE